MIHKNVSFLKSREITIVDFGEGGLKINTIEDKAIPSVGFLIEDDSEDSTNGVAIVFDLDSLEHLEVLEGIIKRVKETLILLNN